MHHAVVDKIVQVLYFSTMLAFKRLFFVITALTSLTVGQSFAANPIGKIKCHLTLKGLSLPYKVRTDDQDFESQLNKLRRYKGRKIKNGVEFRELGIETPELLTLRIKQFFFEKILSGEKKFEFREIGDQNNALIISAMSRGARFLRLHFQNNDIQLLAVLERIEIVPASMAVEPWDKEQGIESGKKPNWRIRVRDPELIWDNPAASKFLKDLKTGK